MLACRASISAPVFIAASLCVFVSARPAVAQTPADQVAIDLAIERGKSYLLKEQKPEGHWGEGTGPGSGKGWGIGYTALAGLALLECGVPTTDPHIKKAANLIRANVAELDSTYEVSLSILFLDRMKSKGDKQTIQWLACKLIVAQSASGGWGYTVEKLNLPDVAQLLISLKRMTPPPAKPGEKPPPFDIAKARAAALAPLTGKLKSLPVFFDPEDRLPADPKDKTTDNSNTHFAMLGLWAARKYDVPTDRTFTLVTRRFRTSQGGSGTWGYGFAPKGADGGGSTTCVALLGVAIGHVVAPEPDIRPETDPITIKAFVALSKMVGEPVNDTANRPTIKDVGGLYYLWSMERIAVLFDVKTLGKKDWYLWGAEILLCHQAGNGSWDTEGGYHGQTPVLNTCFALLFLRRANLTPDLSKKLLLDPKVLTAKVDTIVAPPPPPPPSPKVETPSPTIEIAPPPHTVEPKPTPTVTPPAPKPTPPSEPEATRPAKKTPWLPIVIAMFLAGAAGGGLAFFIVKRRKKKEEEGANTKKKKGKKKAAKVATAKKGKDDEDEDEG